MRNVRRASACILTIVFSTMIVSGCFAYEVYQSLSPTIQPISDAVDIGSEWIEVVPPEPLKSRQSQQFVQLKLEGVESRESDYKTVVYDDGRRGKIEAQLLDDKGRVYELALYGLGGEGGGVHFYRKLPPSSLDAPPTGKPDFPIDSEYVKLRIRSDVPIRPSGIQWVCITRK